MLSELYIENLAVIEKATIDFSDKLNVFTGETGAGKSILINGINAILGQRVTKDIVRTGTDKAVISALFTDIGDNVLQVLDELGISAEDGQLFLPVRYVQMVEALQESTRERLTFPYLKLSEKRL